MPKRLPGLGKAICVSLNALGMVTFFKPLPEPAA
jgi:hypothetical protein